MVVSSPLFFLHFHPVPSVFSTQHSHALKTFVRSQYTSFHSTWLSVLQELLDLPRACWQVVSLCTISILSSSPTTFSLTMLHWLPALPSTRPRAFVLTVVFVCSSPSLQGPPPSLPSALCLKITYETFLEPPLYKTVPSPTSMPIFSMALTLIRHIYSYMFLFSVCELSMIWDKWGLWHKRQHFRDLWKTALNM